MAALPSSAFWRNKRVLLTGHTGFKGGWLAHWLECLGAEVTGIALPPEDAPNLFSLSGVAEVCDSRICDLLQPARLAEVLADQTPDIVFHLAAQPLVRRSLLEPAQTFATNVQGTVNLLEWLVNHATPKAVLVVTSDKVYRNDGSNRSFREDDPLGGTDPYSASKAAAEIAVRSFAESYFRPRGVAVATARGGNVIGGGDFSQDRIVPDCVRAAASGTALTLRHPEATRPWQHVLDCLAGYLLYAEALCGPAPCPPALNFGPDPTEPVTVGTLANAMLAALDTPVDRQHVPDAGSREAQTLALDPGLAKQRLGWRNRLTGRALVAATADWYRRWQAGEDMGAVTRAEIQSYEALTPEAVHV